MIIDFIPMERKNYWILVLLLPATLLVVVLYANNFDHTFWAPASKVEDTTSREILGLLKSQEQGLLHLWNSSFLEAGRASILTQLRYNQEIQHLFSGKISQDNLPRVCNQGSPEKPRKIDQLVKWEPNSERYLLVVCTSGQISNHLICLEKHMFFAALLKRTLVLPSPSLDYDYEKTLDIGHIGDCLGNRTVITFKELLNRNKTEIRLLCYMHDCYFDKGHEDKLMALGLRISGKSDAWPEESSLKGYPSHPHSSEITSKFSSDDEVLGVGDLFYADVESKLIEQIGGPLVHSCKIILRPNRLIVLTAQRFVQTFLGDGFMSLHFRRHGFLKFCNVKEESCFFPVPQAAKCILSKLQWSNSEVIYISTDAADSEINLLQNLLTKDGHMIPLVKRPSSDSREKWDALLTRKGLLADNEVVAMLDKTICAMAKTYVGTSGSTFSDDIMRMRREWRTANSCDGYLCEGERPNFISDIN